MLNEFRIPIATCLMCHTWGLNLTADFQTLQLISAETADFRYQVWHKNHDAVFDRHSLVVVPGLKSKIFHVPHGHWLKNFQFLALAGSQGLRDLKFCTNASNILYFDNQSSNPRDLNFFIFSVKDA